MTMDEQTVESDAWAVISNLRDQHPRLPDDCPTDDIVVALAAAGLLAAPAAQPPTPREWMNARDTEPRDCGRVRDRDGVIWCRRSDGGWHAEEVEWNPTGDEWKTGFITRLSGDNAGITLHDNAQPLTVSTRNLRSALAALREGQQ